MTINDPKKFKIYKDIHNRDGTTFKRWVPMGKSIANLYQYAEISKAANKRFLDSMQNIISVQSIEMEINDVWSPDVFRLFEEISDEKYLIRDFTNQNIQNSLNKGNPD